MQPFGRPLFCFSLLAAIFFALLLAGCSAKKEAPVAKNGAKIAEKPSAAQTTPQAESSAGSADSGLISPPRYPRIIPPQPAPPYASGETEAPTQAKMADPKPTSPPIAAAAPPRIRKLSIRASGPVTLADAPSSPQNQPVREPLALVPEAASAPHAPPPPPAPTFASSPKPYAAAKRSSPPFTASLVPGGGVRLPDHFSSLDELDSSAGDEAPRATRCENAPTCEPPLKPLAIAATAHPEEEHADIVQVFYGTDRFPTIYHADRLFDRLFRFLPALAALAIVGLLAWLVAIYRRWWSISLLTVSLLCASYFLYTETNTTLLIAEESATHETSFTNQRNPGGKITLGMCEVSIPHIHEQGELEAPSLLRFEVSEDVREHIVLTSTEVLRTDEFHKRLRERVDQSPKKEVFVFVHGFNVSFKEAACRTAQIAHDMEFAGAPVFYSWPSNQSLLLTYSTDETNVAWAAPHLKKFLLEIARQSQADSINLIAHSMGNRALTAALKEIRLEMRDDKKPFNQVVLAAPDMDAADFAENIASLIVQTARRTTLYASNHDDALRGSKLIHSYPRLGDSSNGIVIVNGIDTVDVSDIDHSPWGHSYYGSSDIVLQDMRRLFEGSLPPTDRPGLAQQQQNDQIYWAFDSLLVASGRSGTLR